MRIIVSLLLALVWAITAVNSAWAQEDPPPLEGASVSGIVVNLTTGDPAPEGLSVMLHGWSADGEQRVMLHGESVLGGVFSFEDVQLEPDVLYAAMAVYQDVTYISTPTQLLEDGGLESLRIEVYETTGSDDHVTIDQHHIILGFAQGGLSVAEIYTLTNGGDRTVKDAILLEDDRSATLQFPLPAGAANLSFPTAPSDRFIPRAGGFADTRPLIPGAQAGQVVVAYILQYDDELTLEHIVPYDTERISVLLPHASGLSLDSDAAEYLGTETFADGESYETYQLGASSAGDRIALSLSGRPEAQTSGMGSASASRTGSEEGIALGIGVLGLTLIAAGVWWWRRERIEADVPEEEGLDHDAAEEQGSEL
ncbi:MAG: hypothetical protein BMS9Abin28_1513 [Anaerolineae bacterium]|nr:MAG: hypothetical protein BMS9Abin28_1513 [Anaerolineae bacterium]